jgi:hypothetical protein
MPTVLALHVDDTIDLTAVCTLLLALVTFASLLFARGALRSSQEAISLSQTEVERAHLPVLVPIVDHRRMDLGPSGMTERVPRVADGRLLIVPVENIGTGPALRLQARAALLDATGAPSSVPAGPQRPAVSAGLGVGCFTPLEIEVEGWPAGASFELTVVYEDVARKRWRMRGNWINADHRYMDVQIEDDPIAGQAKGGA